MHHFFEWNDYTDDAPDCDEEKAQENADLVEGELESLDSILTEKEYLKIEEHSAVLSESTNSLKDVLHVMNLSIVPDWQEGKIHAINRVKNLNLELRKFPPVELTVALVKAYPSHRAPLVALKGPFY